jgi:hypothetical protein
MRLKLKDRRAAEAMTVALNRSTKHEGLLGLYDGKPIVSRFIHLAKIEQKPIERRA